MILGIGSDITDVRRIEKVIARHGERFITRIFTEKERARAERKKKRVETYAKRFAAKEACAKALGTGMRDGVWWRDMGVVNLPSGRPTMQLTGGALQRLQAMTPQGYEARIDLTISDEGPMAQALVVISAVPKGAFG
jgi:holo-[acyl-carrier protein] synthase